MSVMLAVCLAQTACRKPTTTTSKPRVKALVAAREGFSTHLIKKEADHTPPSPPPAAVFDLVRYPSPAGNLAAYISPDPGDGKKHPIVLWLFGGFSNGISDLAWAKRQPVDDDQSAAAYRKEGLLMMYPSLRGGSGNPGFNEGLFGEVDDVLAAADYASRLPWVDPSRIYLGGHSTGGTLALLTAEAAPTNRFRAVISFGPVGEVAGYGKDSLPFDNKDPREGNVRAPIQYLDDIDCPTFVIEGEDGNRGWFESLRDENTNKLITFTQVAGQDHFTALGPANALLASKIADDVGEKCSIRVTEAEIQAACVKAHEVSFQSAGDLRNDRGFLGVVFYYGPEPATPSAQAIKECIGAHFKGIPILDSFEDSAEPPFIVVQEEKAPLKEYPVPKKTYFKYAGRGLSAEDVTAIQETKLATSVVLVAPAEGIWKSARAFNVMAHDYAQRTKAVVWDSATRECFHRDAWKKIRMDAWGEADIPNLRSQITIHAYKRGDNSGHLRAVTLGMEKFALPDVAIEQLDSSDNKSAGNLMNVFCQAIATNPIIADPANFPLSLESLMPLSTSKFYKEQLIESGSGKCVIAIMSGTPDEGDTDNSQVSLDFRHGDGSSEDERRSSLLSRFWGSRDSMVAVKHDEAIKRLSDEAKVKFLGFKAAFQKGLEPGARMMVKAPFTTDDGGTEWMWIELLKWDDDDVLRGILKNQPTLIKDLKEGASTTVKASKIFDYLYYHSDGTTEGNETGKLFEKK